MSGRVLPIGSGVFVSGSLVSIAADVGAGAVAVAVAVAGAVGSDWLLDSGSLAIVKVVPNDHIV